MTPLGQKLSGLNSRIFPDLWKMDPLLIHQVAVLWILSNLSRLLALSPWWTQPQWNTTFEHSKTWNFLPNEQLRKFFSGACNKLSFFLKPQSFHFALETKQSCYIWKPEFWSQQILWFKWLYYGKKKRQKVKKTKPSTQLRKKIPKGNTKTGSLGGKIG